MSQGLEQIRTTLASATDDAERARLYAALALALSRVNPVEGLEAARTAEQLAVEEDDLAVVASALCAAAFCHETLSEYSAGIDCGTRSRVLFRKLGNRLGEGESLNALGVILSRMSDYSAALETLREAHSVFSEIEDLPGIASTCNNIGMVQQEIGNYSSALQSYLEALRINTELGQQRLVAVNTGNVSNIYYYLNDFEKSFEYDLRALAISRSEKNDYGTAHALESIASNYKARGEYNQALEVLNESIAIFRALQERRYESAARIKVGSLMELQNDSKGALACYQEALSLAGAIGASDIAVNAQLHIGKLHSQKRRHKTAIPILRRGLAEAREASYIRLQCDFIEVLAHSLNAVGEHPEAYHLLDELLELRDRLHGEQQRRAVAEMQARFDVERAERERDVLQLKNRHLEETMEVRSKELTSMAMRLVQKNAFLQRLRKETLQLVDQYPEAARALESLGRTIIENQRGDDEWERFEQEFQHVHTDFLRDLAAAFPRLTPSELKICALLKVNLSNKEIANLLAVSLRSIESHRFSIRKKMGLSSDTNLAAHLAAM